MKLSMPEHGDLIRDALNEGRSFRDISREIGCDHHTVAIFARVNFPDLRKRPNVNQHGPAVTDDFTVDFEIQPHLNLLVIDIETRPALGYVWGAWKQNLAPIQIIEEKEVISFAARWIGEDEEPTEFMSSFHDGKEVMIRRAHELLDRADGVIGYNSKRFDAKHLNTEFWKLDIPAPSPYRHIDLLNTVKQNFIFMSNKLDNIADKKLGEHKLEHEGFALWLKCMADDADAWERMRDYNIHDVGITEDLYYSIRGWIQNHPSYAAVWGDERCPNCGSEDRIANGYTTTKTGRYHKYQCRVCGKHYRDTHRVSAAPVTETSAW